MQCICLHLFLWQRLVSESLHSVSINSSSFFPILKLSVNAMWLFRIALWYMHSLLLYWLVDSCIFLSIVFSFDPETSNTAIFTAGLLIIPWQVFISADQTCPSDELWTFSTRPVYQVFGSEVSSVIITMLPTWLVRFCSSIYFSLQVLGDILTSNDSKIVLQRVQFVSNSLTSMNCGVCYGRSSLKREASSCRLLLYLLCWRIYLL